MTTTPNTEPTLTDVINKLDNLSTGVDTLWSRVDKLSTDVESFNYRFENYQKATQWLV